MASTKKVKKDKKDSKKDYEPAVAVHRVLLAIMQLQKGSNENAFNLEDIRDQARLSSRLPSAQFGRVGCGWILSFNKALKWMTKVRILQNVTLETVAFSDLATMVLSNSAHLQSIPNSSSPEENYYWQELIGFSKGDPPIRLVELQEAGLFLPGRKRSVSEESSPNKRARISDRPKKKKKKVKETLSAPPRLNGGQPTTGKKRGRPRKIQPQPQVEVQENTDEEVHLPQENYTLPSLGDDEMEVDIENDDDDQQDNEDEDDENEEGEEDEDEDEEEEDDDDDGSEYGELNESEEEVDYTPRKSSVARAVSRQSTIANDEGNEFDVPRHNVSPSSQRTTLESNSASCYQGIIHLSSGSYTLVNPSKTIVRHAGPHAPPAPRSSLRESYTHETIHDVPNGQPHTYNNNIDVDSVRDRDQGWSRHPGPRHLPAPSHPNQHKTNNHTNTNNNHNHNHNHHNNVYQPPGLIDDRTGPRYTTQSPAPSSITPKGNGNLHVISRQTTSQPRKSSAQSQSAAGSGARAISTPEGASGTSTTTGYPHHHHPQGGAKVPGYRHDVGPTGVALSLSPKLARLETLAIVSSQRDETIFALEDAKEKLGAELSELHRSCERAEHTVVRTTQQLQDAVREVNGLKRERAYTIDRLRAVKKMNDEACSERDMLKKEVEGMKERETDLENSHRRLEGRINDLVRELEEMKRVSSLGRDKDKESTSPIDNMNDFGSNDPASHAGGDEDDDEDLERTPTVSKSRTVENPIGVQMQSLGNDSLSNSRDTGKGKSAERSRSPSVRSTAAAKGGASNYVPNTTSTSLTQDDDLMDSSLVDFQITQNEHPAGARLSMSEQLENAGKRELEILTGLREKIGTLVSTFQAQEKANQVLQDEVHATRALLIELEQTDRGQMSAQASSQFEGVLRAAIADVDDVGDRLGKGNLERKELGLQLGKTKDGVKNLGDFLRDERQRSSLLAAKLEESLGKTRSLEDELEYYRKMKTIDPNDMKGVYDSFGAFKQLQMKALGDLGFKVKDLRQ